MTNQPTAIRNDSTSVWLVVGISTVLVLMVAAVFGQTFGFGFLHYDDNTILTANSHVLRGLSWENLRWVMTAGIGRDATDTDFWRPLSLLSHMADVSMFGLNAGWHHLVSVAIHAATSVLLFLVLRSMTGALWRSAFVAALFAIHPLHVESVAWVGERKDVLSALFFVITLGGYALYTRRIFSLWNYLLVVFLFALALMSKPMVVTLPFVLLLLDYWPLERSKTIPPWKLLLEKLPLFAMSASVALLTTGGPGYSVEGMASIPLSLRLANATVACMNYIQQGLYPADLVAYYPYRSLLPLGLALSAVGVLAAISAFVFWQRSRRYLAVGWLWYLGMLVPVLGIIQTTGVVSGADHYTYLPLIGLFLGMTWLFGDLIRERNLPRSLPFLLALLALIPLSLAAHRQTSYWRNEKVLWEHALACMPDNHFAYNCHGGALFLEGKVDEAIVEYRKALALCPSFPLAHNLLGIALLRKGMVDEAITHFEQAFGDRSENAEAFGNLGLALSQQGRAAEAISYYRKALSLKSHDAEWHGSLGALLMQSGQFDEAGTQFREALAINPLLASTHGNYGTLLIQQGRVAEALNHLQNAVELSPDKPAFANNLAWVLATGPDPSLRDGIRALQLAKSINLRNGGSNPSTLRTLAAAYAEAGYFPEAAQTAQNARQLALTQNNTPLAGTLVKEAALYTGKKPLHFNP